MELRGVEPLASSMRPTPTGFYDQGRCAARIADQENLVLVATGRFYLSRWPSRSVRGLRTRSPAFSPPVVFARHAYPAG